MFHVIYNSSTIFSKDNSMKEAINQNTQYSNSSSYKACTQNEGTR